MKTRKIKISKKRLLALLTAAGLAVGGITITSNLSKKAKASNADSQNQDESVPYTYYYTIDDVTFISNGENIGYVNNDYLDLANNEVLNYNVEFSDMYVNTDNVGVYLLPGFDNEWKHILKAGDKVTLNAYSNEGWAVVNYYDDNNESKIGFVNCSFLSRTNPLAVEPITIEDPTPTEEPIIEVTVGTVTGDGVNVRRSANITNDNVIGSCNKGETFEVLDKCGDWYYIDYCGEKGYISSKYITLKTVNQNELSSIISSNEVVVAKITGNNVNVRLSPNSKTNNEIGFCDVTDKFEIISREGDWYYIKYLDTYGYVNAKYVKETVVDRRDLNIQKMVALNSYSPFYSDTNGNTYCYLPENQNVLVIKQVGDYYKVNVDGVIGYVNVRDTKRVTRTCIVVDLSRQIIKTYKEGKEVFRAHTISGRKSMQTEMGCFTIGHHTEDYTFPDSGIRNEYWMQYNNNIGFHPADANYGSGWQPKSHFTKVAQMAYEHWSTGNGRTYPDSYGSHGCNNMMLDDIIVLYDLCDVGDNVLVISQNDLMKQHLLSSNIVDNKFASNEILVSQQYRPHNIDYDRPKVKKITIES